MDSSTKINMLDDIFSSYLLERNGKEFCKNASSFLSFFSSKVITVSIVDNQKLSKEPFFGMRIFPNTEEIDHILKNIMEDDQLTINKIIKHWESIKNWYLEIDSRVFDRMVINFNPEELTAMTLHD